MAVAQNDNRLEHVSTDLKSDKEVVLTVVAQNGCALRFTSVELKADNEVVLAAVKQHGSALEYASADLRSRADEPHGVGRPPAKPHQGRGHHCVKH